MISKQYKFKEIKQKDDFKTIFIFFIMKWTNQKMNLNTLWSRNILILHEY